MDMGTFAIGCMNYEIDRNNGKLPEHDIEFQQETNIGPVYNNGISTDNENNIWWAETIPLAMCKLVDGQRKEMCILPENHFPDGFVASTDGRIFIATTYGHNITIINPIKKE